MDYLDLCLIAKNEDDYLQEWVDYHILLGVEHFYIYDNDSAVSIRKTLEDYILAGWVSIIDIHGPKQQMYAYDHCLRTFGKLSRWIGFIDTDEFFVPKTTASLPELLEPYEACAGLAVSSLFFGSGKNKKKPACGQIAAYRQRTPTQFGMNRLVKSIMQPSKTLMPMSPHLFFSQGEDYIVNENFQKVYTQYFPHHSEKIQLNHYFTRSYEEITEKLKRGRGDAGTAYRNSRFDTVNQACVETDTQILDLLEKLLNPDNASPDSFSGISSDNTYLLENMHEAAWQRKPNRRPLTKPLAALPGSEYEKYSEKSDLSFDFVRKRDWDSALRVKSELIEMTPLSPVHFIDFASLCLQKGDYPLAWRAIAQAWKLAPQSLAVLRVMADYYLCIQDFAWLEKISQMLIADHPKDNTSYFPLAMSLLHQGQIDKGLDLALDILPSLIDGSPFEQLRAGLLIKTIQPHLFARNEVETINRLYLIAILLHPEDVSLFITLIQMNLDLKKTSTAEKYIKQALSQHPNQPEILALKLLVKKPLGG
ncbi:MAG: glycosyltransferase family 92 protein [Anaerolineaceae bacterium]